ncbi:MAG: ABC transporter permease [Oscillospiraceae bacterium]|nr:ABC transporter permease [Oscillospiraceae bacterium]
MLVYRRKGDRLWLVRIYPLKDRNKITAPTLWLKTLLRSPAKSALTLLLIAAATFMLLYTVLDYAITKRTYDDTYSQYHGYVMLEHTESELSEDIIYFQALPHFLYSDPDSVYTYNPDRHAYDNYHLQDISSETINEILALPYLDEVNTRYMTAGISEYERVETEYNDFTKSFFNYTDRVIVEGTLQEVYEGVDGSTNAMLGASAVGLDLRDIKVLGGSEESLRQSWYYIDDNSLHVKVDMWTADSPDNWKPGWIMFDIGINRTSNVAYLNNIVTPEDISGLTPGERYIFVLKIEPNRSSASGIAEKTATRRSPYAFIGDDTIGGFWPYIYSLEGKPENYLETAEFANLRKLIEVTNADRKTLDVVYIDEMSSIKRYQDDKLMPVQGRMLTAEDTENSTPVCVIGENFAAAHGLSVGDRITLQLGDRLFEQYTALGALAASPKRYADNFTEQEFEIVGTFFEAGLGKLSDKELFYAYSDNTVFVPQSFLTVSEEVLAEHAFKPGEISFVIPDAGSIMAFKEEYTDELEAMGYTVAFYDGGWPAVERQLLQAGKLSGLKLAAFATAAVLALWLTVYLFILRKKKEFAVMRALGCPTPAAVKTLLFPLLCLSVVAIAIGSAAAVMYTRRVTEKNYAEFAELGLTPDLSLPVGGIVFGVLCSVVLLMLISALSLRFLATRPPLALLQDSTNRGVPKPALRAADTPPVEFSRSKLLALEPPEYRKGTAPWHTLRYIWRHMRRTGLKSLLALLLALVLCFAMGFFTVMRQTYGELYRSIEILPRFVNGFSYTKALEVADSKYVSGGYYEYIDTYCESNFVPNTVIFSNDLSRVCPSEIEFRDGVGMDILSKNSIYCVISRDLAEKLGVSIGDKIELCRQDRLANIYSGSSTQLTEEEAMKIYHDTTAKPTVAGIADDDLSRVYLPVRMWESYAIIVGLSMQLDIAEYTLNNYHEALNFRAYAERQLNGTTAMLSMETEEADRIYQTYRLIELLYPIAFAVAILLGGVLPGIIILQSAKEAALLRILGTTKRRTRVMLTLEQIMLCLLGLVLAAASLAAVKGRELYDVAGILLVYLSAHFVFCASSSTAASISVTKRKVLELLQVKE